MELIRKNVRLACMENKMAKTRTYDEDMNVPDTKGDVARIICSTYKAVVENVKTADDKAKAQGIVDFDIMYLSTDNGSLEHLEGRYPFEESFELNGVQPDTCKCKAQIQDFTVKLINSRKVNIKSLINVTCACDMILEEDILTDVNDDKMLLRRENISFLQIKADCEDNYRIKEDITLPKNKPNVRNLIWNDVRLKARETRVLDDCIFIKGDVGIFAVYMSDQDEMVQWYETSVPFEGRVDVSGVNQEMYAFVSLKLQECSLNVKPDYDGEERVFQLEAMVGLDIKAYSEEENEMVCDMYSLADHVNLACQEKKYQQMVIKNSIKCRGYNKYKINDMEDKPLQICYAYGTPHLESTQIMDGAVTVEGYVDTVVVYICADDLVPMSAFKCQVPFSQMVNLDESGDNLTCMADVCVDQINASMISGDEIEVRVFVGAELLVMREMKGSFIEGVEKTPMSVAELSNFPGIVGYIAGKNELLWDVAKKYKTTTEKLSAINKLNDENVRKGMKLIVTR